MLVDLNEYGLGVETTSYAPSLSDKDLGAIAFDQAPQLPVG